MWSGLLRIFGQDRNKPFNIRRALMIFCVAVLAFFTVRGRFETPDIPLPIVILGLDLIGILYLRHATQLRRGMDLLPFFMALLLSLTLQVYYAAGYYNTLEAVKATVLLAAMMACGILLCQKDCAHLVWKAVSAVNLLTALCIILQMILLPLNIRLDKLGALSNWLFNAWEFTAAFRPCGPFLEPEMYAQLGLLALYDALFLHRSWPRALITTAALLLSTSALALVGAVLLYGLFLLGLDKFTGCSRRAKFTVLALAGGMALVSSGYLLSSDIYIVQRALSGSSIGVRLLRSVDLFALLSPLEKLFGLGLQNQELYLNHFGITLAHDTYETLYANKEFASVLGYIPCTLGLVGLLTFLLPFIKVFFQGRLRVKVLVGLFLFSCLFCSMLSNCIFVIYILAIYCTCDLEQRM